jgi:hypothetical protein
MRQGTFHPILDNLHPTHIAVPASATFACLLPAYRLQLLTLGSVTTSPTHQDTSGVTTLEWLAIGEALTSAPTTAAHTHTLDTSVPGPPQTTSAPVWQQLMRGLGTGAVKELGAGCSSSGNRRNSSNNTSSSGSSSYGPEGVEVKAWHCFDEGAAPAVMTAALWDGGAGAASSAIAAAGTGEHGVASTAAAVAADPVGMPSLGWPGVVYLPSPGDVAPGDALVTLAAAWHAAMGASSTPYTCARGR